MERVSTPIANLNPNFISSWIIKPLSLCDEMVEYFESKKEKQTKGASSSGVNTDIKESISSSISSNRNLFSDSISSGVFFLGIKALKVHHM